jgi:PAS domain S-box-containing protein
MNRRPLLPVVTPPSTDASLILRGVDVAPIGVSITDAGDGTFVYVNDTMCSILGRRREELERLTIFDVTHPAHHDDDRGARRAMLAGALESYHADKRYVRPDGTSTWLAVHVVPIRDRGGEIEAFFAQKVDITDRVHREERLARYVSDAVWLGRIRDALDEDRMVLYAQPIVDLHTKEVVQCELLLRMRDDDGSIVLPGEFLAVAERYGLIAEIDRWVIRQAVRIAAAGNPVQFNLSATSITNPDVLGELAHQIETNPVDPSLLIVEVTETAIVHKPRAANTLAAQLSGLGCGLALDDFGTGFGTLSLLKHLPATYLKIDIDFVRAIADDETDQRLVRGIVALAREFGLTTTAEGIEDPRTANTLEALGVDRGQGFLFARPEPLSPLPSANGRKPAPCPQPTEALATVRSAFRAVIAGDLAAARAHCHPALVLRLLSTASPAGRELVFRGHEGLASYFSYVQETWDERLMSPRAFWEANGAVVVAGEVTFRRAASVLVSDVLWVIRLRDDLIASVQAFELPQLERAPIT